MSGEVIRHANVAMLFKLEATEGVDAAPVAGDAFPFEQDGYSYNNPFTVEDSREATGSLVAGAPLVVGQPAQVTIRFRMKGANATYSASVKPPQHALLCACGKRGLFTAAISAAALAAGGANSATLGTGYAGTAQLYRGLPLTLSVGPGAGRTTLITDYSAAKVAQLADSFSPVLDTTTLAAIPPNWSYAGTSPRDAASRVTDHPSGTLYLYEDGTLRRFVGCRGVVTEWGGDTARPGFMTVRLTGVYLGRTDAALPAVTPPLHAAPILAQGPGGLNPAFLLNRLGLPIQNWSIDEQGTQENPEDPNTDFGFGPAQLGARAPTLRCNPLATLVATRDVLAEIAAFQQYPGVIRAGSAAGNRWAITTPIIQPVQSDPGTRGQLRSEENQYRMLSPGLDAQNRDGESILTFY